MSEKERNSHRESAYKPTNGIPDRIWELYFGPQGQVSKLQESIGKLHGKINDLSNQLDNVESMYGTVTEHSQAINLLQNKLQEVDLRCIKIQEAKHSRQQTLEQVKEEASTERDEEYRRFLKTMKIILVIFAGVSLFCAIVNVALSCL